VVVCLQRTNFYRRLIKIDPRSRIISHSLSELALKKAEISTNKLERQKHLDTAKSIAITLSNTSDEKERPTHTILKTELEELLDVLPIEDSVVIERKVKNIQKHLEAAVQQFPDSSFILDAEAKFSEMLNRNPLAIESLKKAFKINKRSTYLALRLSRIYENQKEYVKSIDTLKECLERNPGDKSINFRLSYLMGKYDLGSFSDIKYHLRRSFTVGDDNYLSQFWYARILYIDGSLNDSWDLFNYLKNLNIDNRIKQKVRGYLKENGSNKTFTGTISRTENSYCIIIRDGMQDRIFSHITSNAKEHWEKLSVGRRVVFNLAFNFRGPQAINVELEKQISL
jgi:tetratricopeptide (TPR) repeat protein